MKLYKFTLLATIGAMSLGFAATSAHAAADVYDIELDRSASMEYFQEWQQDEPCQGYREPPAGYYMEGCTLMPLPEPAAGREMPETTAYSVNFGFDEATLTPSAQDKIARIAADIKRYNPSSVTIAGYTDTAGPQGYNEKLSERRAEAIIEAFNRQGIPRTMIDERAYGEKYLAVQTQDGVPLYENRRAVIQYSK